MHCTLLCHPTPVARNCAFLRETLEIDLSSDVQTLISVVFPHAAYRGGILQSAIMGHIQGYDQIT